MFNIQTVHLIQFPSKRWGFVGKVDYRLCYEKIDGSDITRQELHNLKRSKYPALIMKKYGIKTRTFASSVDACQAASALNVNYVTD